MKQLFLCGGKPWDVSDDNVLAYALKTNSKNNINIAFCAFACTESEKSSGITAWKNTFNRFAHNKKCTYKLMTSKSFREDSAWADVIHMPGGSTAMLMGGLNKYPNLHKLWDDKILSGSSAGADVMCKNFVSLSSKQLGNGFSWIPATCIPHWGNYEGYTTKDWEAIRAEALKKYPDVPVLCIPEGQFVHFAVQ